LRWNYLNKDEKAALKEVGITSNKDFLDPKKAAIGTVTVLGVRYNQQLNDKQKQDVWKYLPSKWNNRANYGSRVKSNSSYLSFKQLDKKQEGGEFSIAQVGMEKKSFPSYKDFLASIKKDKVVDYKERPREVVIESTKTIVPETPKKLTKQQAKIVQKDLYENPFKPEGITSGDKVVDFLYNNEWLMDVPILGGYIKDKAKEIATNSGGSQTVSDINKKAGSTDYSQSAELGYTGNFGKDSERATLVDQYFSEDALLPESKYKPKDDYLEFLPSYSVKGSFNKNPNQIAQLNDLLNFNTQDSKYREFLKNKKPIYLGEDTGLPDILGLDLGGHKTGIGWDDKMNLPYLSVSDAWDFEPSNYSKKWAGSGAAEAKTNQAFIQSYLMHKAGNPFKIYDRFYFNPETRQYIPDDEIGFYQKGGEKEDTSWTAYLNPANWGTSRYDDAGTFKEAFRAARNEGDSDFLWKGERYSTELKPTIKTEPQGITPELLIRQAYRESKFNPKAISPKGYKGIGQIGDNVIADYKKANNITGNIDPFNIKQNSDVQKYSMNELYNSSFINKPNQSEQVRLAKTLAAYNWGRGNLFDLLGDLKEEGADIYNSLDWINKLPEESRKYVNDILLQKNTIFNNDFSKAVGDQKNKSIKSLYGYRTGGESKPGPLMKAYNRLPAEKKMGGAIVNKKEFGGQLVPNKEIDKKNITMYKDYVKGIIGNEIEAVKNYDKLNRIYYNKAKELGMTASNYVMTYIVGNS
jgi:hypothetical protein